MSKISDSEPTWGELARGLAVPMIFGAILSFSILLFIWIACQVMKPISPGRYEGMVNLSDCIEAHQNRPDYCR